MLRILHVDDSLEDFELTRVNLARKAPEFELVWSESAENALKMLKQEHFDCILCDYQMPGFNGLELLKTIRSLGDSTPFIFFTGQGSEEIAAEALRIGADDYFSKDPGFAFYDRIINSIKKVVESHRRLKEQKQYEERYALLFDSLTVGVAVYEAVDGGKDFIFKDFNRTGERMEGAKREDIKGRRVTEVFPGVKDFGLLEVFKRVFNGGVPEQHPVSFYKDERHQGWRRNYVYKLPTGEVVAIFEDVTLFKEALQRLQVNEEQLTLALEASRDGIWDWKIPTGEVIFSPGYMKMLGYESNELPNRIETFEDLLHPDDRQETMQRISDLLASGAEDSKIELRMKTKVGAWKKILTRGRIVERDKNGRPLRMVGTLTDIDDMMLADKDVQRAYQYLAKVLEMTGHAVIAVDAEARVIMINGIGERLMGRKASDAVGKPLVEVISVLRDSEGNPVAENITALMERRDKSLAKFECLLEEDEGKVTTFVCNVAPIIDPRGELSGTVIVVKPLDESPAGTKNS